MRLVKMKTSKAIGLELTLKSNIVHAEESSFRVKEENRKVLLGQMPKYNNIVK